MKTSSTIGGAIIVSLVLMFLSPRGIAGSKLSFDPRSESEVLIRFQNDEPIAAIQFTLHCSSNITLHAVSVIERMESGIWTAWFNKADDSTMYVVLMRTGMQNLSAGDGAIAALALQADGSSADPLLVSFDDVVASSPSATRVVVEDEPLEWHAGVPEFTLSQNYPNPFNPTTSIPYTLETTAHVSLTVYDMAGREIRKIAEGLFSAGTYLSTWEGTDNSGSPVPSGIYFVRLQVADRSLVRKMILTR